jgi:hypothetical protein
LTKDHVPPQGCIELSPVEIQKIVDFFDAEKMAEGAPKGESSQNGVKFRSICDRCNNYILGSLYDPYLCRFASQVAEVVQSRLYRPYPEYFNIKPQKVIRAVLGHILAFVPGRIPEGESDKAIADYVLDEDQDIPHELDIYVWLHPSKKQFLVRDAGLLDTRARKPIVFKLMKFFPLSFFVTWKCPSVYRFDFLNLSDFRGCGTDEEVRVRLPFDMIPHIYWPQAPRDNEFVMFGEGAMGARVKR